MKLSVAICTWNRAAMLDRTLDRMERLEISAGVTWELLVVNNGSTDDTDEVIARRRSRLPIRRIFEAKQGLSHARNAAIDEACGEAIVWTDDDVLVDRHWLAAYAGALERWPGAAYFGGVILPWYEVAPPAWVVRNRDLLKGMLVIRDLNVAEGPFPESENPFGANMAFRRKVFERRRFDARFGLAGNTPRSGEETGFVEQLRQEGAQGIWVPDAQVWHFIPQSRMTRQFLWRWAYGWGMTGVRMQLARSGAIPRSAAKSLLLAARYATRYAGARILGRHAWVRAYYDLAETCGAWAESRQHAREKEGAWQ